MSSAALLAQLVEHSAVTSPPAPLHRSGYTIPKGLRCSGGRRSGSGWYAIEISFERLEWDTEMQELKTSKKFRKIHLMGNESIAVCPDVSRKKANLDNDFLFLADKTCHAANIQVRTALVYIMKWCGLARSRGNKGRRSESAWTKGRAVVAGAMIVIDKHSRYHAMNCVDRIVLDPNRTYACTRTARTGVRIFDKVNFENTLTL